MHIELKTLVLEIIKNVINNLRATSLTGWLNSHSKFKFRSKSSTKFTLIESCSYCYKNKEVS